MKLLPADRQVETVGSQESQGFAIDASPKGFFLLSDGLYSFKIRAAIRESCTNGHDSHVEANKDELPLEVHLPNSLEPWFSVRDQGVGMCHEDCMTLFRTYFRSTKSDSNDAVGCLGLGSKASFAYTDSFTVESFYNGVRRCYTGYKTNNGPMFDLMSEEPSDEPTGILIKFPVKSGDYADFRYEALNVFKHFKVKPKITGAIIDFSEEDPIVKGDTWGIFKGSDDNCVVMGQVSYPIDEDQLGEYPEVQEFLNQVSSFRLYVDIGAIDITPSREALSYNPITIKNLATSIENIVEEISETISEDLESCSTLYEARMKYLQMEKIETAFCDNVSWNGQKLFDDIRSKTIKLPSNNKFCKYFKFSYRKTIQKEESPGNLKFTSNTKIVFKDTNSAPTARIGQFIRDNGRNGAVVLYTGELKDLLELLGGATEADVTMLSDLPKPHRSSTNSGGGVSCQVYDHDEGEFVESKMSVKYTDAIFIPEARGRIYFGHRSIRIYELETIIKTLEDSGADFGGTFYIVKPSVVDNSKLRGRANWSDGIEILKQCFNELTEDYKDHYAVIQNSIRFSQETEAKAFFSNFEDHPVNDLVAEYDEYHEEIKAAEAAVEHLDPIRRHFSLESYDAPASAYPEGYFNDEYKSLIEKYSFLNKFNTWDANSAQQYIADMDELAELRKNSEKLAEIA